METYRAKELGWFKQSVQSNQRTKDAPFRVIVMHQPDWGWSDGVAGRVGESTAQVNALREAWSAVANDAKVDLVIAGHWHTYNLIPPGKYGGNFPILVVGQNQVAKVDATENELHVTVMDLYGSKVATLTIPRARPFKVNALH